MTMMYVANDGMIFDNRQKCEEYEKLIVRKKRYEVELYFTGTYYTTVSANNEDEAKAIAFERCDFDDIDYNYTGECHIVQVESD